MSKADFEPYHEYVDKSYQPDLERDVIVAYRIKPILGKAGSQFEGVLVGCWKNCLLGSWEEV